jgi:DNA-binding transcriptional ArsR family regulator
VRDQIVDAMGSYGESISPKRLSEVTGKTLGSVAYHVRTLLAAGVVELADERRVRGAIEHLYALVPDYEAEINDPLVGLQKLCGALTLPTSGGGYPQPVVLDQQARAHLTTLLDELRPTVERIVRDAASRAGD